MPYRIPLRADIFWPCANPKFVIMLASVWIKMVKNTGIKINVAPRAIRDIVLTNMQHFERHRRQCCCLSSRISAVFILQSGHNVHHTKQRGLVMSLVGPLAVSVSYNQTLSPRHPNTLQPSVSKEGIWQAGTPLPCAWHLPGPNMFSTSFTLCFAPLPDQGQRPGHRQICTCEAEHPSGLKWAVNFV